MGQSGWINLGQSEELATNIRFDQNGDIYVNDQYVDRLEISAFEDMSRMQKVGDSLFRAPADMWESRVEDPIIHQGKLENSNVEAVNEMVSLIELQRSFETTQKALRTLDDALAKAANNIGNFR